MLLGGMKFQGHKAGLAKGLESAPVPGAVLLWLMVWNALRVVRCVSMGGSGCGRERSRCFVQAQVFEDPIDASHAACAAGLRQCLRDDCG